MFLSLDRAQSSSIDYRDVRELASMAQVLQLFAVDAWKSARGATAGTCPIHRSNDRTIRTFRVQLARVCSWESAGPVRGGGEVAIV